MLLSFTYKAVQTTVWTAFSNVLSLFYGLCGTITLSVSKGEKKMPTHYLNQLIPEDVVYLLDLSEFKGLIQEMLGEASEFVTVEIDWDKINDNNITTFRPMVMMKEIANLTEEKRHTILNSGFSLGQPFESGDYAMERIFGENYTIMAATEDQDGDFFTVEVPYADFIKSKQ